MTRLEPYSRLYHRFSGEFPDIYADDRCFATWVRLLLLADASWPMRPPLPRSVRTVPLRTLCDAGLVVADGDTYSIRGLDAERTRRRDAARTGAAKRWQSDGNANADATAMPRRDETRRDEQNARAATDEEDDGRSDLEAFLLLTRRAPTAKQRKLLDSLLERRDITGPDWAANVMLSHPDDPIGAVIAADQEWRAARIAEARSAEKPKPRPRRKAGLPTSTRELIEHWAAQTPVKESA